MKAKKVYEFNKPHNIKDAAAIGYSINAISSINAVKNNYEQYPTLLITFNNHNVVKFELFDIIYDVDVHSQKFNKYDNIVDGTVTYNNVDKLMPNSISLIFEASFSIANLSSPKIIWINIKPIRLIRNNPK